jgi:hypothetical protein
MAKKALQNSDKTNNGLFLKVPGQLAIYIKTQTLSHIMYQNQF